VMPSSHSGWLAAVKPENIVTSTWLTAGNLPALRVRQRLPRADAPSRSPGPVRIARSFWSLPNRTATSIEGSLLNRGVDSHISPSLASPPKLRSPVRGLAVMASLAPLMYPMPYPISQAHRAQPEKRSQEKVMCVAHPVGGPRLGMSALLTIRCSSPTANSPTGSPSGRGACGPSAVGS
jgi:hypothetical protein